MKLQSTVVASVESIREELARTKLSASTMNFIVWIDDPERRAWILERAELLGEKHPSFELILDRSGGCGDATVITSDRDWSSHFTVQGERVVIDVSCAEPEVVVEYVGALTSSTVPTVLWWSGTNVADRPHFQALLPYATMLLVDSSGGKTDDSTLRGVIRFHRNHPEIRLRDLAWLRLHPWQDMIAAFFDDPRLLNELYGITALHITSGSEAEALYLAGWLASRLGWTASERGAFRDRDGNAIAFTYERAGAIRRIRSVCLDSATSWYHAAVPDETPDVVRVWVDGQHAREPRLYTLPHLDNASLLERAVLQHRSDEVFETALQSIATLLG
jgi:hypothetical protein